MDLGLYYFIEDWMAVLYAIWTPYFPIEVNYKSGINIICKSLATKVIIYLAFVVNG